jgi:AraC-like DNA-binding protein
MQLIGAGTVLPDPRWRLARHAHRFHELILVIRGRMQVTFDDGVVTGASGDVIYYAAGSHHAEASDSDDPVETRFMAFIADLPTVPQRVVADRDGRLRAMGTWLAEMWRVRDPATVEARNTLAAALVAEWRRLLEQRVPPLVAVVHDHIARHLERPIAVADLARVVSLSPFHFQRRYRSLTGSTPMTAVRRARAEAARHLVVTSDLPLSAIPARVGLSTVQHLTRLFRQELGTTPGALRRGRHRSE